MLITMFGTISTLDQIKIVSHGFVIQTSRMNSCVEFGVHFEHKILGKHDAGTPSSPDLNLRVDTNIHNKTILV